MSASTPRRPGGPQVLVVGHVTRDRIVVDGGPPREQPGGSAFYVAAVHARLGLATTLLTKLSARDRSTLLEPLRALGVQLAVRPAAATTRFENSYAEGTRRQRVQRVAPPIQPADFQALAAPAIQLGPLTPGDLPGASVAEARRRADWLALDLQGLARRLASGRVRPSAGVDQALLALADIVKADRDEARVVTGLPDPRAAARRLAMMTRGEAIVTLGGAGAVVAAGDRLHDIAAVDAGPPVDTTGCGDSFLAAYLARRLGGEPALAAGRFAAAVSAIKATRFGPFAGDEAAVHALLQERETG